MLGLLLSIIDDVKLVFLGYDLVQHLAYEYARRGARLALVGRRENALREVVDRAVNCGCPDVIMIVADVSKAEDCKRLVDETISHFGRCKYICSS